ncbi:hypothetical protein PB2503_04362 [Parvularcula bermudensis HTCC2503]|uniref:TPR domain protein n=1 Tax=Parvularcula bermudensis (strain ATCC BAA-594 / HTCC2503 / KCTC 12087) TaxID=314260 RepID=E0TER4_PARBH|nr:tetratricopeptide repeat protein [Parvularcula bermudensis]ADM08947.1 hypothetical protein PB2503_04362 [Parvularcula bermudensis HTCC2503]
MGDRSRAIGLLCLLGCVLGLLSACENAAERAEKFTELGNAYLQEGDTFRARIQFDNALRADTKHEGALRGALEVADIEDAPTGRTIPLLEKLVAVSPTDIVLQSRLADTLIAGGTPFAALAPAEASLALAPQSADAARRVALVLALTGNDPRASPAADLLGPDDPVGRLGVALKGGSEGTAQEILTQLRQSDPENASLGLALADSLIWQGRDPDRADRLLAAVEPLLIDPNAASLKRAELALARGDLARARSFLRGGSMDSLNARAQLLCRQAGQCAVAVKEVRAPSAALLTAAAREALGAGRYTEAEEYLQRLPGTAAAERSVLDIQLALARGQTQAAVTALAAVRGDSPDLAALRILAAEGADAEKRAALRRIVDRSAEATIAVEYLVAEALAAGDADQAAALLHRMARRFPSRIDLTLAAAEAYRRSGDFAQAKALAARVRRLNPAAPGALRFLASLAMEEGKLSAARRLTEALIEVDTHDPARQLRIEALKRSGQSDRLTALLEAWRAEGVSRPYLYRELAEIYGRTGKSERQLSVLQAGRSAFPSLPYFVIETATLQSQLGRTGAAETTWRNGLAAFENSQAIRIGLANLLMAQERRSEALRFVLETPVGELLKAPSSPQLVERIDRALPSHPVLSAAIWRGLARQQMDRGETSAAAQLIARSLQLMPNDPDTLYWAGQIQAARNEWGEAEESWRQALALLPDTGATVTEGEIRARLDRVTPPATDP